MAKAHEMTMRYRRERQFGALFGTTAVLFCLVVGMLIARGF
jgi:hypothetical protein